MAWLNATKKSPAHKRVVGLRAEMEYLGAMLESIRQEKPVNLAEARLRHKKLTQDLARYAFRPAMPCDLETGTWRYLAVAKGASKPIVDITDGRLTVPVSETDVIAALARLAANRELFKAHLCEQCREVWHTAVRKIDRFCSSECRERFRGTNEESRERHARHQREYRERLKSHVF